MTIFLVVFPFCLQSMNLCLFVYNIRLNVSLFTIQKSMSLYQKTINICLFLFVIYNFCPQVNCLRPPSMYCTLTLLLLVYSTELTFLISSPSSVFTTFFLNLHGMAFMFKAMERSLHRSYATDFPVYILR
jgi:hypothetical protein